MPNFFTENPDLLFHFDRLDLREAVSILEHGFAGGDPEGPGSYEEALELYRTALELIGEISGDYIAERATGIDLEGAHLEKGEVRYAPGTLEAYKRLADAGFTGVMIPRRYGGINFPATIYMMMIEMVSRADASLMTLFGYQDVGEAIAKHGTHEQCMQFLLGYTAGSKIGAMVLTEPGAGSDLQAIRLQATEDESGQWRLKGVKHFISNGNGDVLLVLARSEPDTPGMFGLSLFAVDGSRGVQVARIEEKMGLHGSPTCELFFDDAEAELIGKRRFGLFYVIDILNHARFSVAAQALGIAEGAYGEALAYAREREQFGKKIYDMPPIANMLVDMRVTLDACRAMLYRGSEWLDRRNKLDERVEELKAEGEPAKEERRSLKAASRVLDLLSPLVKYIVTEAANRVCYDAQQLHGGTGYIREVAVERHARDVRITTIYEGTTQVLVGMAIKHVLADVLAEIFDEGEARQVSPELEASLEQLRSLRALFLESSTRVRKHEDERFRAAAAKDLTDIYGNLFAGHLLIEAALEDPSRVPITKRFVHRALAAARAGAAAIEQGLYLDLDLRDQICR